MKKRSDWKLLNSINKRGDIWVSAILYFGLGIIVLTLILGLGMPVINRLKDKNIGTQTKEVFASLDQNVREVARGGPGTQRVLQLQLDKGEIHIYDAKLNENLAENALLASVKSEECGTVTSCVLNNTIVWSYPMKSVLSEPGMLVEEGKTKMMTLGKKGGYTLRYWLDYYPLGIYLKNSGPPIVTSGARIIIKNIGTYCLNSTAMFQKSSEGDCINSNNYPSRTTIEILTE